MDIPTKVLEAVELARAARAFAHAPYSRYKVGAAVKMKGVDEIISGVNVENASFGASICAERNAITTAVTKFGPKPLEFVVVCLDEAEAGPPCGLCLQVIAEFAADDTPVYLANVRGVRRVILFKELLPIPFRQFTPGQL